MQHGSPSKRGSPSKSIKVRYISSLFAAQISKVTLLLTCFVLQGMQSKNVDGKGVTVAIVHCRWNPKVVMELVNGAVNKLKACGVKNIIIQEVPGSVC